MKLSTSADSTSNAQAHVAAIAADRNVTQKRSSLHTPRQNGTIQLHEHKKTMRIVFFTLQASWICSFAVKYLDVNVCTMDINTV